MAKPFKNRIVPFGEWILVRRPQEDGGRILVASTDESGSRVVTKGAPLKKCLGIVVAMGEGSRAENGVLLPHPPNLRVGGTVVFADKVAFQLEDLPEMKEHGLYFVPCHMVIAAVLPDGVKPLAVDTPQEPVAAGA
jgi:co-chaperonin GroES (HSP10)